MKRIVPRYIKRQLKILLDKNFRESEDEKERLKNWPRYTDTEVEFLGNKIQIPDIASFNFTRNELFNIEIYKFFTNKEAPYIIDCGANIGLSVIYFKKLYPKARIIAFEPDSKIFKTLEHNVQSFGFADIELINKACWSSETTQKFYSEGADGGRTALKSDNQNIIEVKTTRLRKNLQSDVDFLKIDIEGAENEVLHDVEDLLIKVDKIFVEYHSFVKQEQKLPEILKILKTAGFRLHISSPGLRSPMPFMKLSTYANMDNQLNIYGLREYK